MNNEEQINSTNHLIPEDNKYNCFDKSSSSLSEINFDEITDDILKIKNDFYKENKKTYNNSGKKLIYLNDKHLDVKMNKGFIPEKKKISYLKTNKLKYENNPIPKQTVYSRLQEKTEELKGLQRLIEDLKHNEYVTVFKNEKNCFIEDIEINRVNPEGQKMENEGNCNLPDVSDYPSVIPPQFDDDYKSEKIVKIEKMTEIFKEEKVEDQKINEIENEKDNVEEEKFKEELAENQIDINNEADFNEEEIHEEIQNKDNYEENDIYNKIIREKDELVSITNNEAGDDNQYISDQKKEFNDDDEKLYLYNAISSKIDDREDKKDNNHDDNSSKELSELSIFLKEAGLLTSSKENNENTNNSNINNCDNSKPSPLLKLNNSFDYIMISKNNNFEINPRQIVTPEAKGKK